MTTPLDAMYRALNSMEEELSRGAEANLSVISEKSDTFHRITSRYNWAGNRLETKDQFVARWLRLDAQVKALVNLSAQQQACKTGQLSLPI